MIIGIPKEIKNHEARVSITPAGVEEFTKRDHKVVIESGAGLGSGFSDQDYSQAGASIRKEPADVWQEADMILKVKEPLEEEYKYLREGLIVFTYLHLAADEKLTDALLDKKVTALAYETVQLDDRSLPLLTPMSEVAGRMAVQEGAVLLEKHNQGKGLLIDGVPGVPPAHVVIIGAGVVGTGAIKRAAGSGARVTVLDVDIAKLKYLNEVHNDRLETLYSNSYNIKNALKTADLVISSVLIPGARAPKLVTEQMVKDMEDGSVIVDIAIDQGGSVETIASPTSIHEPIFVKHGVVHYAVPNVPGAVPRTSTLALTNVTLRYALEIADKGLIQAARDNRALRKGINTIYGRITYLGVAEAFNREYTKIENLIK